MVASAALRNLETEAQVLKFYNYWMNDPKIALMYDNSDFCNYGYWDGTTTSARQASENLVEKLLAFIPYRSGTILDVACGLGATTREVLKHYAPENVTGIN